MKRISAVLLVLSCIAPAQEKVLFSTGFEEGWVGWKPQGKDPMAEIVKESARSGKSALRVRDESVEKGSELRSTAIAITGGSRYRLRFFAKAENPAAAIFLRFLNGKGGELRPSKDRVSIVKGNWTLHEGTFEAPSEAVHAELYVRSFLKNKCEFLVDDLQLVEAGGAGDTP